MPYFAHPSDQDPPSLTQSSWSYRGVFDLWCGLYPPYVTRETAQAFARRQDSKLTVSFVPNPDDRSAWFRRERDRFEVGTYVEVPWTVDGYLSHANHFAHLSTTEDGLIAFTLNAEHGIADRQTRMKPGRYLNKYYADVLSPDRIAAYVAQVQALKAATLQIATTTSDIRRVYMAGPPSCMDGAHLERGDIESSIHPSVVYAAPSDLAVAYWGDIDGVSQRSVIWPDKQRWARIYGTGPLERLLTRAGYTQGSLSGAHVLRIADPERADRDLMPYIDTCEFCNPSHKMVDGQRIATYVIRDTCGDYRCQGQQGFATSNEPDEPDTHYRDCDHCNRTYDSDDEGTSEYCQRCEDNRTECEHCDRTYFDHDNDTIWHYVSDDRWCEACYTREASVCQQAGCAKRWIEDSVFDADTMKERERIGSSDYCYSCAMEYVYCETCNTLRLSDDHGYGLECRECDPDGRTNRCTRTLVLPLETEETEEMHAT